MIYAMAHKSRLYATAFIVGSAFLLTACQEQQTPIPPHTQLPPFPADLVACFKKAGVEIPQRKLTAGEVERMWASDRLTIVAKQQCGARAVAWYDTIRKGWR